MTDARLDAQGLRPTGTVHSNLIVARLVEHAVRRREGQLGRQKMRVVRTAYTNRPSIAVSRSSTAAHASRSSIGSVTRVALLIMRHVSFGSRQERSTGGGLSATDPG